MVVELMMEGEDAWLTVNDTSSFSVTCTGPVSSVLSWALSSFCFLVPAVPTHRDPKL